MKLRATSSAIGMGSMAAWSYAECVPWAYGTSPSRRPRLGRMALPNGLSDRSGVSVWIILSPWARHICARSCEPTLAITMRSERLGHWIKMRRSLAQFSGPEASNPIPYLADFITTTCGIRFSVHTSITRDAIGGGQVLFQQFPQFVGSESALPDVAHHRRFNLRKLNRFPPALPRRKWSLPRHGLCVSDRTSLAGSQMLAKRFGEQDVRASVYSGAIQQRDGDEP